MINIAKQWGISPENSAGSNASKFKLNIESGQKLFLPKGTYPFTYMAIYGKQDIELFGDDAVIQFAKGHSYLGIINSSRFNIHDLIFDGSRSDFEGGVWVMDGCFVGTLSNLDIHDAHSMSLVIGNRDKDNPAYGIVVENCNVYGQRNWDGNAKAMILAGGYSHDIMFENCNTYSVSPRTGLYSPADHFDTDNAEAAYIDCTADGTGHTDGRRGVGFWNEAGGTNSPDHKTSSYYYGCKAIETRGGLGAGENSKVYAVDFTFKECSKNGWAVCSLGNDVDMEVHDSVFDNVYSKKGYREGGVQIRSGTVRIENCEFKNMQKYNVSVYSTDPKAVCDVTLVGNHFDGGIKTHGISKGSGSMTLSGNRIEGEIVMDGNYEWNKDKTSWLTKILEFFKRLFKL